ncbi:winged helix-turn-helix transcriptional regulator [Rhodococcus sp. 21391]|nr:MULTISPECIES: winged helix-turn-helix transcriptional regulator [Rhodococcus]QQZ16521.1 winged helix-turn-helix transcriptional regulator [Rhodococcus sp. 21391]
MRDPDVYAGSAECSGRCSRSDLRAIVDHRFTVEVLDVLSQGSQTGASLGAILELGRRTLMPPLRILAAHGLVVSDHIGSWDSRVRHATTYRLTDRGRRTADLLSSFWVWASLYEPDNSHGN